MSKPAKLSNYIDHLPDTLWMDSNQLLLLHTRVSTLQQKKDGSLKRQADRLVREVKAVGGQILFDEVFYNEVSLAKGSRRSLECLSAIAKEYGAVIVAETADRFIRGKDFDPKTNPSALPTEEELIEFTSKYNCAFVSVIHPDTTYKEIKSYQSKVEKGMPAKHHTGWRKERREKYLERVLQLRRKDMSYGAIAERLNLTKRLVQFWCSKVDT